MKPKSRIAYAVLLCFLTFFSLFCPKVASAADQYGTEVKKGWTLVAERSDALLGPEGEYNGWGTMSAYGVAGMFELNIPAYNFSPSSQATQVAWETHLDVADLFTLPEPGFWKGIWGGWTTYDLLRQHGQKGLFAFEILATSKTFKLKDVRVIYEVRTVDGSPVYPEVKQFLEGEFRLVDVLEYSTPYMYGENRTYNGNGEVISKLLYYSGNNYTAPLNWLRVIMLPSGRRVQVTDHPGYSNAYINSRLDYLLHLFEQELVLTARLEIYYGDGTVSVFTEPVLLNPTRLLIRSNPASQTVQEGQTATFGISATGFGLSYQWYRDGVLISGATSSTLIVPNAQTTDDGRTFKVRVQAAFGQPVDSPSVTLTVSALPPPPPAIASVAVTQVNTDQATVSATLTGQATRAILHFGPTTAYGETYEIALTAGTSPQTATFDLNALEPGHDYHYMVEVAGPGGTVTSQDLTLTTTPYVFVPGTYHGLAGDYGRFIVTVAKKTGLFTGKVIERGYTTSISGVVGRDGQVRIYKAARIRQNVREEVSVALRFTPNGVLTGTLNCTSGTCSLNAELPVAAFTPSRFTAHLKPLEGFEGGRGYAVIVIDKRGILRLSGRLPDNSIISQGIRLTASGWFLYVPLSSTGFLQGHIAVNTQTLSGTLRWKKAQSTARAGMYLAGLDTTVEFSGSSFKAPAKGFYLLDGAVTAELIGGNLPGPLRVEGTFVKGRIQANPAGLSIGLYPANGLVRTVVKSGKTIVLAGWGTIDQATGEVRGFYPGASSSGLIHVYPSPQ